VQLLRNYIRFINRNQQIGSIT